MAVMHISAHADDMVNVIICCMQLAAISLLWLVTNKNPAAVRMVARAHGFAAVLPFLQDSSQLHRRAATFITCQLLEDPSLQVLPAKSAG